ncbi:MAG: hypothetical protein HYV07_04690 [Deltaproteobacteria bacterium]|nr:hypothetical protein [Deltaproteobacteria bacterium]
MIWGDVPSWSIDAAGAVAAPAEQDARASVRLSTATGLFAIARAMGGYCGAHPADVALDALSARCAESPEPLGLDAWAAAVADINARLWQSRNDPGPDGHWGWHMGHSCCLAAMQLGPAFARLSHVGDCRIYRFREPSITAGLDLSLEVLTSDHSLARTFALAESRLTTMVVSRAIGSEPELAVDVSQVPVRRGDGFLVCSEVVPQALTPLELREILKRPVSAAELVRALMERVELRLRSQDREHRSASLSKCGLAVLRISAT